MAITTAVAAFGTTIGVGSGSSSGAYTTIAEVVSINGVKPTQDFAEATHFGSPSGWDEHIPTIRRLGTIELELNCVLSNAQQVELTQTAFNAGTKKGFKITFTDTGTAHVRFMGYVESFEIVSQVADKAVLNVTIRGTGVPTWTA